MTFFLACVDSFRDAYVRTGMNLVQSMVVLVMTIGREGLRRMMKGGSQPRRRKDPPYDVSEAEAVD